MHMHATARASFSTKEKSEVTHVNRELSIFVRCLIERRNGQWQAFTLEFGLAVQGASEDDVKQRLEKVIYSYVYDALIGEDREHAEELLSRRAAAFVYARYYFYRVKSMFKLGGSGVRAGMRRRDEKEPRPRCAASRQARASAFLKAKMKETGVTYVELVRRLEAHGFKETEASITMKLKRGTFAATFLLACLAALELEGVRLEDI